MFLRCALRRFPTTCVRASLLRTTEVPSSSRNFNFWQVFSKDAMQQRREQLGDELRRSYVQEIKQLKDTGGKVAPAITLSLAEISNFPRLETMDVDGNANHLPPNLGETRGSLVTCIFRSNAQPMVDAWISAFAEAFQNKSDVHVYQLSLVESGMMSMPGFRHILLSGGRDLQQKATADGGLTKGLPLKVHFHFGDTYLVRRALHITNRLTGYVYLVDQFGRVRFAASGMPEQNELREMEACMRTILSEKRT
mmetsp:Transcript_14337/g.30715  ORF Transcript_14337/g.30715 Transcript_14337/m.30715 type:complete len:252 (-) Transcript_14337:29-784(-)|eukprot:CAMPEP_0118926512 /NCGR_PEP_ID=MMETSP1169-20130426/4184_1 /TAXON_ID=36882 /ORGANISM="Pyramimonas obovata, Strain CCMP722" /LENGTH=251 /DNA_ID=CAMNT_0006868073 /DNA_START=64 /DNA_END=815 /DNA_ORIENTATION=-